MASVVYSRHDYLVYCRDKLIARALRVDDGESLSRSYPGAVRVYLKFTVARRLIMLETHVNWLVLYVSY
jgi:hypothetical protein